MRKAVIAALVVWPFAASAQDATERAIATEVLTRLQAISFEKKREYCGFIGFNNDGKMVATKPVAGDKASCGATFPKDIAVTASYHTHGTYDEGYFNEVPSVQDMDSDRAFFMNGYVSTPGGRLWFVDTQLMVARMLCNVACLPVAPNFRKGTSGEIAVEYGYDALVKKLDE